MASADIRRRVLMCFKELHKVRKQVFAGDTDALTAGRHKINDEFRKNKGEQDPEKLEQLLKVGSDAGNYLKSMVVQAQKTDKGVYEIQITKDTKLLKNHPYMTNGCENTSRNPKR